MKIGVEEKGVKFYAKRNSFFQFNDYGYQNAETCLRNSHRAMSFSNTNKSTSYRYVLVMYLHDPFRSYKNHKT